MSFIAFEGIARSGKSSLSLQFVQYLNKFFRDTEGLLRIDPHFGEYVWTKEPLFANEEAELLNAPGYIEEYKRERIFFESRMKHQDMIAGKNVVCDRYLWSGIACAYKYSPGCFRFLKELYLSENLFLQPDLYVFIDTPPEVCVSREAKVDLDALRELRDAYLKTRDYIRSPIITIEAINGEEDALHDLVNLFESYMVAEKKIEK